VKVKRSLNYATRPLTYLKAEPAVIMAEKSTIVSRIQDSVGNSPKKHVAECLALNLPY
jgi:hypothetical protein